jgi:hypothetical protein
MKYITYVHYAITLLLTIGVGFALVGNSKTQNDLTAATNVAALHDRALYHIICTAAIPGVFDLAKCQPTQ